MKKLALLFVPVLFASGCAYSIHEVHTSDFIPQVPITSGRIVKANTEQFVILGIVGNTDYVDDAYHKLMSECPNGILTGITTQYSTAFGFFSWTNKILMQGLCLAPRS